MEPPKYTKYSEGSIPFSKSKSLAQSIKNSEFPPHDVFILLKIVSCAKERKILWKKDSLPRNV